MTEPLLAAIILVVLVVVIIAALPFLTYVCSVCRAYGELRGTDLYHEVTRKKEADANGDQA